MNEAVVPDSTRSVIIGDAEVYHRFQVRVLEGPDAGLVRSCEARLVLAPDLGLARAGLWCTPEQLASRVYATVVDGTGVDSNSISFSARLLCFNG
jgi:hypothetical protein